MLKTILMAGSMLAATPLLAQMAQTTPVPPVDTAPVPQTAPTTPAPAPTDAAPAAPAAATPTPAAPATASAPVNPADAVAQAVDTQFATYDRNGDGRLNRAEFEAWMVALKTQSDPSTSAAAPATKKWLAGAFATADKDRNAIVTRAELTGYLSRG